MAQALGPATPAECMDASTSLRQQADVESVAWGDLAIRARIAPAAELDACSNQAELSKTPELPNVHLGTREGCRRMRTCARPAFGGRVRSAACFAFVLILSSSSDRPRIQPLYFSNPPPPRGSASTSSPPIARTSRGQELACSAIGEKRAKRSRVSRWLALNQLRRLRATAGLMEVKGIGRACWRRLNLT